MEKTVEDVEPKFKDFKTYRKKPVCVQAVQLNYKNWSEVCDFLGDIICADNPATYGKASDTCGEDGPEFINVRIPTLEGSHLALHGDWIIKGVSGEFYPCKPNIFQKTYEAIDG